MLAGVGYHLSDPVTLGLTFRWVDFGAFESAPTEWHQLRSHDSTAGRGERIVYRVATDDSRFLGPVSEPEIPVSMELHTLRILTRSLRLMTAPRPTDARNRATRVVAGMAFLATVALGLGVATAQEAALSGTVTDTTGLNLPDVTVEVRIASQDPRAVDTALTDGTGRFTISALSPGTYDVTFALPGFRPVTRAGVVLRAGVATTLVVELTIQLQEQVVVVGTRAEPRSVTESAVPIDAISSAELTRQGATTLQDQLRTVVPSFNVNIQPISDASTVVRPATLRNLAPDHTLVLVNGKRRHRSSIIAWAGGNGGAFGSQGPDLSAIPSIALRQVEVLRAGAAAQYGSDAIAGVLNFLLKDARSGGSVEVSTGAFGEGWDGHAYTVAGNVGLPLGATGFANLSLEYGNAGPTDRSIQRSDVAGLLAAGNTHIDEPAQIWGSPNVDDDLKLLGNFGHLFATGFQAYGHATYASKTVTGGFFFRNPNTRGGVFSADGGQTLLIGDALAARGMGSAHCPTVAITGSVPDAEALGRVFADEHCFSFQERFPGGFTPSFGGDAKDMSVVGGLRRFTASGVTWDASVSVGAHQADPCLSGCFSKPPPVVYRRGAPVVSEESPGVSAAICDRRGLSGLLGGVPLAGRLCVSPVPARARLSPDHTPALAMCGVPVSGVADRRDDSPQHEDAAPGVVLGGLFDGYRQAGPLGAPAAAAVGPAAVRNGVAAVAQAAARDGERGAGALVRRRGDR